MSVIRYTKEEMLLAIRATWNRGSIGSLDNLRYMERLAENANAILAANAEAYRATYNDECQDEPAITKADIRHALVAYDTVAQRQQGIRVLDGLRYNLVANNGQDFATVDILDTLLGMFRSAFEISARRVAA